MKFRFLNSKKNLIGSINYTGDPFAIPQKINFTAKCCARSGIENFGEYENLIFDLKTRLHDPLNGHFTEKTINDGQGFEICQSKHFIIYSNTSNEIFCTGQFKNSLQTKKVIDINIASPAATFADEINLENSELAKISNSPFSLCSETLKSYPIELFVLRGNFETTQLFGYQKTADSPILFNNSLPSIIEFLKPYLVVRNSNIQFDINMNSTIFPSLSEHMFIACRRKPIACKYKNKKICNSSRFTGVLWKEFMPETTEILENKQLCERKHEFVETIVENVKHKYLECRMNAAYIPERDNLVIEKRWYADGKIFKTGDLNLEEVDDLKTVTCSIALFQNGVDKIQLCEGFHTENYTIIVVGK